MFKIQKKFFLFLLLFSLLIINNPFVLAYETTGPVWSFKTSTEKTLTTPVTPTTPTKPTEPLVPQINQGAGTPMTQIGPVWSFKTSAEKTLTTPVTPTTPTKPTEPLVPQINQGAGTPMIQTSPVWNFKTSAEKATTTPITPTAPTNPAEPFNPLIGQGGFFLSEAQTSPIWNFTTRIKPQALGLMIESQTGNEEIAGTVTVKFKWMYSDVENSPQEKFDIRIDDDIDGTSPEVEYLGVNSVISSGEFNTKNVLVRIEPQQNQLAYHTTYYWWVRVYNSQGGSSDWVGKSFTTLEHAYPWPNFLISPEKPVVNKEVKFMQDNLDTGSLCFKNGIHLCKDDNNAIYKWDFDYDSGIDSGLKGNATSSYSTIGIHKVMLEITDDIGSAIRIKDVSVASSTPTSSASRWKEISPGQLNNKIK
ncbi:MAG: hypothetical protein ABIJ83_04225 [Patescibacteria group bacterium]|nr:hypothetical protein [Patescibacteria group bacterium]MBU2081093.1 hypothetical protein [Patescibacteria group bacterium]